MVTAQRTDWEGLRALLDSKTDKTSQPNGCWVPKGKTDYIRWEYGQWRYRRLWLLVEFHDQPGFYLPDEKVYAGCGNEDCCNPAHASMTLNPIHRPRGEQHGQAKLNRDEVKVIKQRIRAGETYSGIARDYPHITFGAVAAIAKGESWAHIE